MGEYEILAAQPVSSEAEETLELGGKVWLSLRFIWSIGFRGNLHLMVPFRTHDFMIILDVFILQQTRCFYAP